MLSRERCLDVWNGLWRSIANFTTAEVLQAVRQVALPLSSATALAQINWHLAVANTLLKKCRRFEGGRAVARTAAAVPWRWPWTPGRFLVASECPLWVINRHPAMSASRPLYPDSRHSADELACPLSAISGRPRVCCPNWRIATTSPQPCSSRPA